MGCSERHHGGTSRLYGDRVKQPLCERSAACRQRTSHDGTSFRLARFLLPKFEAFIKPRRDLNLLAQDARPSCTRSQSQAEEPTSEASEFSVPRPPPLGRQLQSQGPATTSRDTLCRRLSHHFYKAQASQKPNQDRSVDSGL